ncbi:MAG: hypothetical protein ACM3OC_04250 [Deltaproteobacteria bacterium]
MIVVIRKTFIIVSILWLVLVSANSAFYYFNNNAKLKRKLHPWLLWAIGIILAGATFWLDRDRMSLGYAAWIIGSTVGFTLYYIKAIVFCDTCGRTCFYLIPFAKDFSSICCSKCPR